MKRIAVVPVLLAGILLAACAGSEPETETVSSIENQVHGMIIDAGIISALCPDGWNSVGVPDYSAQTEEMRADALCFVKGGSSREDLLRDAFVEIRYYSSEKDVPDIEPHKWYDNVADTGEIGTGNYTWSGYSADSMGEPFIWLQTGSGGAAFTASIYTQDIVSLTDADVQAILNSIELSGK